MTRARLQSPGSVTSFLRAQRRKAAKKDKVKGLPWWNAHCKQRNARGTQRCWIERSQDNSSHTPDPEGCLGTTAQVKRRKGSDAPAMPEMVQWRHQRGHHGHRDPCPCTTPLQLTMGSRTIKGAPSSPMLPPSYSQKRPLPTPTLPPTKDCEVGTAKGPKQVLASPLGPPGLRWSPPSLCSSPAAHRGWESSH